MVPAHHGLNQARRGRQTFRPSLDSWPGGYLFPHGEGLGQNPSALGLGNFQDVLNIHRVVIGRSSGAIDAALRIDVVGGI